jgi:DNA-directed RNA polymerase I subunit RPA2
MAIKQPKNVHRGKNYSPYGVEIRCLRADLTTQRNTIHYLTDGNCTLRFTLLKREYFVPVVILLKCFIDTTDREIYEKLTQGDEENTFVTDRVELLLREAKQYGVFSKAQSLAFLGARFRHILRSPTRLSDKVVCTIP